LLVNYNGSHIKALMKLFPELRLKKEQFEMWKSPAKRRNFFDGFARSKHFNPLDADKWYSVTKKEILRAGGNGLLAYYNGSHIKALVKLYPEVIWKKGNFLKSKKGWKSLTNQRSFFEGFARSQNFNPLDAERWYSVSRSDITRAGGSGLLMNYYNGSHVRALMKLYPEQSLKKENFLKSKRFV